MGANNLKVITDINKLYKEYWYHGSNIRYLYNITGHARGSYNLLYKNYK